MSKPLASITEKPVFSSAFHALPGSQAADTLWETSSGSSDSGPNKQNRVSIHSLQSSIVSSDDYPVVVDPLPRLRKKWRTALLDPNEPYEKPWLDKKEPRKVWERVIFMFGVLVGCGAGIYLCVHQYFKINEASYCMILDEDFTNGKPLDTSIWNYQVELGGFNEGSFEWTTNNSANIYVDGAGLHIVPSLTTFTTYLTDAEIVDGYTVNLTDTGVCTSTSASDCVVSSNSSLGTIINPVQSARINTLGNKAIKYGRVEVRAKMPRGDWLWPRISMLPVKDTYGSWPASGEIDIAEFRGNAIGDVDDAIDTMTSTIHWGPVASEDGSSETIGGHLLKRTDYSDGFYTFGLEWGPNYMYTYLNGRTLQVFFEDFPKGTTMWKRGHFGSLTDETIYPNPWSGGGANTPFDQPFYLILDVAVGGTDGWWVAGQGSKPWSDSETDAPASFWDARDEWYPTWPNSTDRGMTIESVKMWQRGKCSN